MPTAACNLNLTFWPQNQNSSSQNALLMHIA